MFIAFLAAAAELPTATAIDPASWFSGNNYPLEAIRKGISGSVTFDVNVDREGEPTACRITVSSGYAILDQSTCEIIQRQGRFVPAKGPDGKPVAGHYSNKAIWRLPNMTDPSYRAVIVDFSEDPLHPVCTVESKGPAIESPSCDEWEQQGIAAGVGKNVAKLVYLISTASGSDVPFPGRPDWGSRVSHKVTDTYYANGAAYPIACVEVAAEGISLGHSGCARFPDVHAPTDDQKAQATRMRLEQSVFIVRRSSPAAQDSIGSAVEDGSLMGVHELEPGHFRCEAPGGDYSNSDIAALPIGKPVTVRFRLVSEHADPKWMEQTGLYFETPTGRKRIQVGKADNDQQHMYVAIMGDNIEPEIVDQYPVTNDWIELTLKSKSDGTVEVNSRGHKVSLDLKTVQPLKTEIHCHSGAFEIQVLRPLQ